MKKELKKADWVAMGIFSILALMLAARGLHAVWVGEYEGTARYSGPYMLKGSEARLMGGAYIGLGLLVFCSLGYQLQLNKKAVTIALVASAAFSILCFVLQFFVTT